MFKLTTLPPVTTAVESSIPGLPPMVNLNMPPNLSTMAPLNIPDISSLPALSNLPPINLPSGITIPAVTGVQLPSVDSLVASMPSLNISDLPKAADLTLPEKPADAETTQGAEKADEPLADQNAEPQQVENNEPETSASYLFLFYIVFKSATG